MGELRPDAGAFPDAVKGDSNGWSGERWLDIRRLDVLGPIMQRRLDLCKQKGFDAVEPDNVDGYTNSTGLPRPRFRPDTRLDRGGLHVESHGGSDGGRWGGSLRRTE